MKRFLKIAGSITGVILVLMCAAVASLSLPSVQQYIKQKALALISETLGTKVSLDDAGISFANGSIALYGLHINDQQEQEMLVIDTIYTNLDMWKAVRTSNIELEGVKLHGITARLYKGKGDSVANYQFLVDTINAHSSKQKDDNVNKRKISFDVDNASICNLGLSWEDRNKDDGPKNLKLANLEFSNNQDGYRLTIEDLAYATNNGKPRKNAGKPNRGAFDAGHLDLHVNCDLTAHTLSKDTVNITMHNMWGEDRGSGLVVDSVSFNCSLVKGIADLKEIHIKSKHTSLAFDQATLTLPDSTRELSYKTSVIKGYTILSDINKPFAPKLKKFTTPLALTVVLSGESHSMKFSNIHVYTPDKRLSITANGGITGLGHGMKKDIKFNITSMKAANGIKEQIINHFDVKESMMNLIKAAGNVTYNGNLHIKEEASKHILIGGNLNTQLGLLNFAVDLDQKEKYITGHAKTNQFAIGRLINSKDFKNLAFDADFKFNTAGKKAAQELHRHLGKLPVGYIKGTAATATYKSFTLHNLIWDVTSDGDIAKGTGGVTSNIVDITCEFSFVNTDFEKSLKCKPIIKFHSVIDKIKDKFKRKKANEA